MVVIGEEHDSQFKGFQTSSIIACPDIIPTQKASPALNNKSTQLPVYDFRSIVWLNLMPVEKENGVRKLLKTNIPSLTMEFIFLTLPPGMMATDEAKTKLLIFKKKGKKSHTGEFLYP